MFQKSSTAKNDASGHVQTVDLAAAKFDRLVWQRGERPTSRRSREFRYSSKGHVHDDSNGSNNSIANNGVYGDECRGMRWW
jgi:hypothetical protein